MSLPVIIAIDFDETIVHSHPFPVIKGLRKGAKKYINKLALQNNAIIIIWTCRTDKGDCNDLSDALFYLNSQGIHYHLVNDNYMPLQKCFGNNCRKISSDFYIDDKGLWPFGIPSWFILYWLIRIKSFFLPQNKHILSHCKSHHYE